MDLWAAAAAAATGYVAKHCQNLSRSKNILPKLDSDIINIGNPESPSSHFSGFRQRRDLGKDVLADIENGLDQRYSAKNQVDSGSVQSLAVNESSIKILDECTLSGDILSSSNISVEEWDSLEGSLRKRSYLRTKYFNGHYAKPLSLIDSSLRGQLRKGNSKVEEYVHSPPPSPSTATMRPLHASNVRQISRAFDDFASTPIGTDGDRQYLEEHIVDVPQLPKVGYFGQSRKSKLRIVKGRNVRCSSSTKFGSNTHIQAEEGLQGGTVLLCLGISIGIISSFISNRREVGKLKELLKQSENLVQDLHEELDMRESLTVKELVNDTNQSKDNPTNNDLTKCNNGKIEESSESMSKIEAELEAELERLGLNMNASISQRELTALDELDPDFAAEFAEGELRVDLTNGSTISHAKSRQERSSTSTPNFENYIVSPRELSLRLHEVVQSRLEERIQELETALQNNQMTMKSVESECTTCQRKSRLDELSETPIISKAMEIEPHKEAYDEELMKVNESEEEDSQYGTYRTSEETGKEECCYSTVKTSPNCWSRVEELFDVGISGDDENTSDSDDEMDQQLIKQIVEKTKKGSPAVMNAQRVLFWTDE